MPQPFGVTTNVGNAYRMNSASVLQQIKESYSGQVQVSGSVAGTIAFTKALQPSTVILAARLAGYQALADQIRLDRVLLSLKPLYGTSASGRVTAYVERDPTAAIVSTVDLANDQREVVRKRFSQELQIMWRPQQPTDFQFNLLNPGTVSLGTIYVIGDALKDTTGATAAVSTNAYSYTVTTWFTLRGRP